MRGRGIVLAVAVAGTVVTLTGEVIAYRAGRSASGVVLDLAIALTYLYGGLVIWLRDPSSRTGPLMVLIGFTWQLATLADSSVAILSWIGIGLGDTAYALLIVLVLAYPTGRFDTSFDRRATVSMAIAITALNVLQLLPFPAWINENPNGFYVGIALATTAIVLIVRRWATAPAQRRSELGPVIVAGIVLIVTLFLNIVRRIADVPDDVEEFIVAVRDIAPAAIPVALLIGFYRSTAAELRRSRARIVEAMDAERRRLERDLHDGAQQRLVAVSLGLRLLRTRLAQRRGDPETVEAVDQAFDELRTAMAELRELARGIHPAVLTQAGLGPALTTLSERSAVPVSVDAVPDRRLSAAAESTAYFVVSEALANVAKHAQASRASISAHFGNGTLTVAVSDDGIGGANDGDGSGLNGLRDRVASVGGVLSVVSPLGGGTTVTATIPAGEAESDPGRSASTPAPLAG